MVAFHTLCEQNADALETTLSAEEKFGDILPKMNWLNMGGGHHITRAGYDIARLQNVFGTHRKNGVCRYIWNRAKRWRSMRVIWRRTLDIVENNGMKIAILDASAACHMPDVIEMPYTPPLYGADHKNLTQMVYRLGGQPASLGIL